MILEVTLFLCKEIEMLRRFVGLVDLWIFHGYRATTLDLAIYRVIYSAYLLVTHLPVAPWLRDVPKAFFRPPLSLAALFTAFPPAWLFSVLNILLAFVVCLLLVGLHTRFASIATSVIFIVLNSWAYSVGGKIDHDILFVISPLVLAFSGWAMHYLLTPITVRTTNRRFREVPGVYLCLLSLSELQCFKLDGQN